MFSINKLHLLALCVWELIVMGTLLVMLLVMRPDHAWSHGDLIFFTAVSVCGILVTGAIGFCSRPFRRIGGVVTGVLCGLAPSILLFSYVLIIQPGFEESAGTAGIAMILAVPSAVGGGIAGLICSWPTKNA